MSPTFSKLLAANIPVPSTWLPQVSAGTSPELPKGGIDWLTKNVVPFTINLLLFTIIIASFFTFIIGGIMWITSSGNKEGTAKAKSTVTYAILGLVIGLAAISIFGSFQSIISFIFTP